MNIKVLTQAGISCTLFLEEESDLNELKSKIEEYFGLTFQEQIILYESKLLNDNELKLSEYGINDGCSIKLVVNILKEEFTISVEILNERNFDIDINHTDTLREIKRKIHTKGKLSPDEQVLVYLGNILDGDDNILSYGLQDKSVVQVIRRLVNSFEIFVKTMDGQTMPLEVITGERIVDITKKIIEKAKLSSTERIVNLIYNVLLLEDDKTVEDYQIMANCTIWMVSRFRNIFQIFATAANEQIIILDVLERDFISTIRARLREKLELSEDEQILMYNHDKILEDDGTVGYYGIVDMSVINVVTGPRIIQILVQTKDGLIVDYDIQWNERIGDLKKNIELKIGLSRGEQNLMYHDIILEDEKTVDDYKIKKHSTIIVLSRLRSRVFQIFVTTTDRKTVTIDVTKNHSILDLKKLIQMKTGQSLDSKELEYNYVRLEDDRTVDYYQIEEHITIIVVCSLRPQALPIFAKTMYGVTVTINVTKNDSMMDIKKKIQERIGLSPDEQRLVYQTGILEDDKTVEYYEMARNSTIYIVARLS